MTPIRANLLALGSAAVLTVYAAGYRRTEPAAERFAHVDAQRDGAAAASAPPAPPPRSHPEGIRAIAPAQRGAKAVPSVPLRAAIAPHDSARPGDSIPASQVTGTAAEAIVPPADAHAPPAADTGSQSAEKDRRRLKDGVYSGWGTSRHGDIEAAIEVRDGQIISASITQCLTRYSCSWIAALPPQVVARQNANVDYVSGATQSSTAFYSAIVEALAKAK